MQKTTEQPAKGAPKQAPLEPITPRLVQFRSFNGSTTAIVATEPMNLKEIIVATIDIPVDLAVLAREQTRFMVVIEDYPGGVIEATRKYLRVGRVLGITDRARTFLRSIIRDERAQA